MKRITLRKGSVIRYADTEESLERLKKMGYKEVDAKPVAADEKPEEDEKVSKPEDEKSEADEKQETDKTPEADEKPEDDKKASGRKTKK